MATFQDIVDAARIPLNDAAKVRYSDAELLGYAKDGLKEAAVIRPDLFYETGQITCIAGVEQRVPSGARYLVQVLSNANGAEVHEADYGTFRGFNPTWRSDTPAPPEIWMRYPTDAAPDERFMVHPPARANDQLEAMWVQCDVDALTIDDDVLIDASYHPALQYYVTARAEMTEDQHTVTQRAAQLAAMFSTMLGVGKATEEGKA